MAIEPVKVKQQGADVGCNNVFLFYLMPLRCEYKCFPVHLMTRTSGNAGPDVMQRIKTLTAELREEKIHLKCVATDGDSAYAQRHRKMFDSWFACYCRNGLESVLSNLAHGEDLMAADLLHILKNARSRLLQNRLTIQVDGSLAFDARDMNDVLNLGRSLTDTSTSAKMRDAYALEIYTLDNTVKLIESGNWTMAYYLLPFALWTAAVRYPRLSTQTRLDFLNIAFEVFMDHMKSLNTIEDSKVSQNKKSGCVQYCCSKIQCVRILNTLIVTISELRNSPDNLAIGRIGTHNVECQFGTIRLLCHHKHSWKVVLRSFSKVVLLKEVIKMFGYSFKVRERENVGGVKIHPSDSRPLVYIARPDSQHSLHECFCFTARITTDPDQLQNIPPDVASSLTCDVESFVGFIKLFLTKCTKMQVTTKKIWPSNPVANNGILARLISFTACSNGAPLPGTTSELENSEMIEPDDDQNQPVTQ